MKAFVPLSERVLSITQLISLNSLLCAPVLIAVPSGKAWILSLSSGDFPLCNPSEPANCNFREKGGWKKEVKINLILGSPVGRMTWATQRNDWYFRFCAGHKRGSSLFDRNHSIYSEIIFSLSPSHLYCIYYLKFSPQAQSLVQQSLSWTVLKLFICLTGTCWPATQSLHIQRRKATVFIYVTLDHKPVWSHCGIFVTIAKNIVQNDWFFFYAKNH